MTDSYVLEVVDVIRETADASSIVFGVPDDLKETFATPDGYARLIHRWFEEMFTTNSDPAVARS